MAITTNTQKGRTPTPGIASRRIPGKSSHCQPSMMNSTIAVIRSTTQANGGMGVTNAPMASERTASTKARPSLFFVSRSGLANVGRSGAGCPEVWGNGSAMDCRASARTSTWDEWTEICSNRLWYSKCCAGIEKRNQSRCTMIAILKLNARRGSPIRCDERWTTSAPANCCWRLMRS